MEFIVKCKHVHVSVSMLCSDPYVSSSLRPHYTLFASNVLNAIFEMKDVLPAAIE